MIETAALMRQLRAALLGLACCAGAARAEEEVKQDPEPAPYHFRQAESTTERTESLVAAFADICAQVDAPERIPQRAAAWGFAAAPTTIAAHVLRGEQGFVWAGLRVGVMDSFLIYNARRRLCVVGLRQPMDRDAAIRSFRRLVDAIPRSATAREDRTLTLFGENLRGMLVETVSPAVSPDRMPRSMLMSVDGSGRWEAPIVFAHGIMSRGPRQ